MDPTEQQARQLLARLSRQEWEVFRRHCQGMSYAAIGRELYVGKSTVQNYLERAYGKLNLLEVHDKEERRRLVREIFAPALLSYPEPPALPEPERQIVPTSEAAKVMVRDDEGKAGPVVVVKPESRAIEVAPPASKEIIAQSSKKSSRWPVFLAGVGFTVLVLAALGTWLVVSGQFPVTANQVEVTRQVTVPVEVAKVEIQTVMVSVTPLPASPSQSTPQDSYSPQPLITSSKEPQEASENSSKRDASTPPTAQPKEAMPTPSPTSDVTILFDDEFTDRIRPEWNYNSDEWASIGGQLVALKGEPFIVLGDETWGNYTLELSMLKIVGWCNISIARHSSKGLTLTLYESGRIQWHKDGQPIPTMGRESAYRLPVKIRITLNNDRIDSSLNTENLPAMTMPGYENGNVSMHCSYPGSVIDNFSIKSL